MDIIPFTTTLLPSCIEPKGYVFVGDSRRRMSMDNMPSSSDVLQFGERPGQELGMCVLKKKDDSRVILLGEEGQDTKIPGLD